MNVVYSINARLGGGGTGNTAYYAVLGPQRAGQLKRVICSSHVRRDIPLERIRSMGLLGRMIKRIAVVDKSARLNDWADIIFDYWSSVVLEGCDLLHCWSDQSRTLAKGKAKKAVTVLECMAHPAALKEILIRTGLQWGIVSPDVPSCGRYRRYLREIEITDFIAVPSEFDAKTHLQNGVPSHKLHVVPYGVDIQRFHPNSDISTSHSFRAIFVGNFSLRKGAPYILDAWKKLGWRDAELWIVGNISPEMERIMPRWHDLSGIRLCGFHQNTLELYNQANAFLFPSLGEGSALVTYEAMACGLPMIVTENAGSLARHEMDGYIIEPGKVDAMADALEWMRSNPARCAEMGRNARERIEPYTWESYGDRLLQLYHQVI